MAFHAEYPLRSPCITQILNLFLAIAAPKATRTEGMVACKNSQILNLIPACAAAVCTIVADERAITKEEEIRIRVEQRAASVATEAVNVPSVASYIIVRWRFDMSCSVSILTQFECFSFFENLVRGRKCQPRRRQ